MSLPELNYALPDTAATDALGEALARALCAAAPGAPAGSSAAPGPALGAAAAHAAGGSAIVGAAARAPRGAVIHLSGELGSGKTALARALLRALGVQGLIRSPTFTLVETYALAGTVALHVDLYRVAGAAAVEELGLRDWVGAETLMLIEWPERGGAAVPRADLRIEMRHAGNGRQARLAACAAATGSPGTSTGTQLLDILRNDTKIDAYLFNFA